MQFAEAAFDIVGIGNAIVDVLAPVPAGFPEQQGMVPASMSLIDARRAAEIVGLVQPIARTGGGSAANTCVVAASLGARVAYLGKVAEDEAGRVFRQDIEAAGIAFPSAPLSDEMRGDRDTALCVILVTPDGQRTMNTYLGACTAFAEADVLAEAIEGARVTYLEGYLFDPPEAQRAFRRAAEIAHDAGRHVALTLSDPFCVGRHRTAFLELVAGGVDILFANEHEILSLYETEDFEAAARHASRDVALAVLTRSEHGSVVVQGDERVRVAAVPTRVVDTTGAGDAYAAGFLTALTQGRSLAECGRVGSVAAAEIISHYGARPEADLRRLAGL
ncbi:adenosine kinase [Lichenicoccus roseus]|uniref:Adenosine kinase n=1 Tax=Lichenicoccus roseus TaxID=2683649 RepID=A0A5R9J672_9PROT|nr:adenosine kinase [Lichenicoccus roseus]TLU73062.1 adenosine kinase [Lichenicoccus roseus]